MSMSKYGRLSCLFVFLVISTTALAQQAPTYKVAASWPKPLPKNWIIGQVGGMAMDKDDHIWVFQRPRSLTVDEASAAQPMRS